MLWCDRQYSLLRMSALSNRHGNSPSLSARSSSIFTEDGCQLVRPRGVRSRMASRRVQIAWRCNDGIRALDGGDDGGQTVVGFAAAGAVQDRLGQAVADIGIHGAQQSALRPLSFTGQGGR